MFVMEACAINQSAIIQIVETKEGVTVTKNAVYGQGCSFVMLICYIHLLHVW